MGVRYVLEGSVQKADQQVRITTQLIEATTGYHLWSEQYDRPLKDIFALQDEIVQKIVTTIRLQLTFRLTLCFCTFSIRINNSLNKPLRKGNVLSPSILTMPTAMQRRRRR
jgi:hypothetical protein